MSWASCCHVPAIELAKKDNPRISVDIAKMTHEEVLPYINKPVRVTLDDGRILAGRIGHFGKSYTVVSNPLRAGEPDVSETISSSQRITTIEDASSDPAAR